MPTFAALVLDAENLRLTESEERHLQTYCQHPIRLKIAVANWKLLGAHDATYHDRGWHLCQVPSGTNSADGRLIALGATLPFRNPDLAEVIVGSADWLLQQLCSELVNQGMIVHRAFRTGKSLRVVRHGENINLVPVFVPTPICNTITPAKNLGTPRQLPAQPASIELPTSGKTTKAELKRHFESV